MKCFNHAGQDAVAQCRGCAKFLCRLCSQEGPGGITCSDECRLEVEKTRQLNDRLFARSRGRYVQAWVTIGVCMLLLAIMGTWIVGIIWSAFKATEGR